MFARCAWVIVLACAWGTRSARAQEVLLELPTRGEVLLDGAPDDRAAALRVGAQFARERYARMPVSPALGLVYRPHVLRTEGPLAAAAQLGLGLRAPTQGSEQGAAERSLTLGASLLNELRGTIDHGLAPGVLLGAQLCARIEWSMARVGETDGSSRRVAPLLLSAAASAGLGLGPVYTSAELGLGRRLWSGHASHDYLAVLERFPRFSIAAFLALTPNVQLFARVRPQAGWFESDNTWTVGAAGSLAVFDD